MSLSFLITQGAKVSHFRKNHSYSVRNCIKSASETIVTDDEQGEIRETERFELLPVADVFLLRSAYVLKITVVVFGMQADAAVYLAGALRQLHDDDCAPRLYQPFYLFGGGDAGNYGQPLFLAGDVQSASRSGGDEGGDAGNLFHGDAGGLQFLIYIMYRGVEACIALCHDGHFPACVMQGKGFGVHSVVGVEGVRPLLAHGQGEAADMAGGYVEPEHDIGGT